MTTYNINIHAHSDYSDGHSISKLITKAKELNFTALVITDHFYYNNYNMWCSLNYSKYTKLLEEIKELSETHNYPIINGIELAFRGEETLIFGQELICDLIKNRENRSKLSIKDLIKLKNDHNSACILCHPIDISTWNKLYELFDGYEEYNSGQDMFSNNRERGKLDGLPKWYNSDAHAVISLERCYNIVDTNIISEQDLIDYIKSGKQPNFYLKEV